MNGMYDKLKEFIENIEQLAADARFFNNCDNYERLKTKLQSISFWAERGEKLIDKEIKNANNKEE